MAFKVEATPNIENGGFEDFSVPPNKFEFFPGGLWGWDTDAPSGKIEIWGSGFHGIEAREGIRFSELNTYSLFQDISGIANGQPWNFEFSHRARVGTDIVDVKIEDLITGTNLFWQYYTTNEGAWADYGGSFVGTGNPVRLSFTPFPTSGSNSGGTYIDGVRDYPSIPAPSSILIFAFGCLFVRSRR